MKRPARATLHLLLTVALALAPAACGKKRGDSESATPPPAPSSSAFVDRLAPDELVEGTETAFGLVLPRDLKVQRRYHDLVYAAGPMGGEPLGGYVQARVREGTVRRDMEGTIFDGVRIPGQPAVQLRIRIHPDTSGPGSLMEIRDVTPPPTEDHPDEAARWRAVGLSPNGQLLDPKHLH